jgi:hypothetical protein
MKPYGEPAPRRRGFAARHPYFALALLLHVAVLGGLYEIGSVAIARADETRSGTRIAASLEEARRLQLQRYVQHLEEMQRRLDAAIGAPSNDSAGSAATEAAQAASQPRLDAKAMLELDERIAAYNLVEVRRRVTLHAGRNTLLFKLYNGIDLMFLSVVITP